MGRNKIFRVLAITLGLLSVPIVNSYSPGIPNFGITQEANAAMVAFDSSKINSSAGSSGEIYYLDDSLDRNFKDYKISGMPVKLDDGSVIIYGNIINSNGTYYRTFTGKIPAGSNVLSYSDITVDYQTSGQYSYDNLRKTDVGYYIVSHDSWSGSSGYEYASLYDTMGNKIYTASKYASSAFYKMYAEYYRSTENDGYNIYIKFSDMKNSSNDRYVFEYNTVTKQGVSLDVSKLPSNNDTSTSTNMFGFNQQTGNQSLNSLDIRVPSRINEADSRYLLGIDTKAGYVGSNPFKTTPGILPIAVELDENLSFKPASVGTCDKPVIETMVGTDKTDIVTDNTKKVYLRISNYNSEYTYRYTLDGSEPTKDSLSATALTEITRPRGEAPLNVQLKVKAFKDNYDSSETSTVNLLYMTDDIVDKIETPSINLSKSNPSNRENVNVALN